MAEMFPSFPRVTPLFSFLNETSDTWITSFSFLDLHCPPTFQGGGGEGDCVSNLLTRASWTCGPKPALWMGGTQRQRGAQTWAGSSRGTDVVSVLTGDVKVGTTRWEAAQPWSPYSLGLDSSQSLLALSLPSMVSLLGHWYQPHCSRTWGLTCHFPLKVVSSLKCLWYTEEHHW
jgi:hypothetical protein